MSIHSFHLLFIVLVTHTISGYPNSSVPLEWSNICQLAINLSNVIISCHVGVDDKWDLDQFRNWSATLDNDTLVSLDVMCETEASICLPWPYRARHLATLKIKDCINTCFFSDFNRPEVLDIPDSLRVFEGYGVTEQFNVIDMLSVDLKSLPPALECGPMSLEVFIYRNTKSDIIYPKGFVPKGDDEVTDDFVQTARDINKLKHVCNYRNMKVYDASQRQDSSSVGIYATFINSRYPNLTTLNYSSTEIQAFPSVLLSWKGRTEKLQILDLSHNNISRFDLRRGVQSFDAPIRVINLTYNSIQTIKEAEIGSFQSSVAQVVDVRQNPLRCDCAMADFSNFLRRHPTPKDAGLSLDYGYLWDLTCVDPVSKRGKQISQFSKKALCNLDVVDVASYQAFVAVLAVVVIILVALLLLSILYRDNVKLLISRSCRILCGRSPINEQNINDGRHKDESSKSTQEKL